MVRLRGVGEGRDRKIKPPFKYTTEYFNEENRVRRALTFIKGWKAGFGRMASKLYRVVACLKD
jgi:hypothetical protein